MGLQSPVIFKKKVTKVHRTDRVYPRFTLGPLFWVLQKHLQNSGTPGRGEQKSDCLTVEVI